jgi:hypothetical protein
MSGYFYLSPQDQRADNYLLWLTSRNPPYLTLRSRYAGFVCPECSKFDYDVIFREGFDTDIEIAASGNFFESTDGFYCFDDKFRSLVERFQIEGLAIQPLSNSGWHVCNIRRRVDGDASVYTVHKPLCSQCCRPKGGVTGLVQFESEIKPPKGKSLFFGLTFDRQGYNGDRDLFATEDVVFKLKEAGMRGLTCFKLLVDPEAAKLRSAIERNEVFKWPKGTRIIL